MPIASCFAFKAVARAVLSAVIAAAFACSAALAVAASVEIAVAFACSAALAVVASEVIASCDSSVFFVAKYDYFFLFS